MQNPGDELAVHLKTNVTEALEHFREANGSLPDRVILFRDAVHNMKPAIFKETEVAQLV